MLFALGLRSLRPLRPTLSPRSFTHRPLPRPTPRHYSTPRRFSPWSLFPLLLTLNALPFAFYWTTHLLHSPLQSSLESHFLLTPTSPSYTLLTSGFFHTDPFHLIFNVFTLRAMLDILAFTTPTAAAPVLLGTYLAGIVGGSLAMRRFGFSRPPTDGAKGRGRREAALGASAGVSALLVAASCVAPRTPVNVMFIPVNIPLALVAGLWMLIDAGFAGSATSTVGHAAHLGGGAVGAVAWRLFLRR